MDRSVLVPIAEGSEELETVAIVDVLRRAGANVTLAAVKELTVTASKGMKLMADRLLTACTDEDFELIALPGGMPGAANLRDCTALISLLRRQVEEGRLFAAICASPAIVLHPHGMLRNKRFTCHPSFSQDLTDGTLLPDPVVVDGNLITSRGAGTAVEFSLALVSLLYDDATAERVRKGMALCTMPNPF